MLFYASSFLSRSVASADASRYLTAPRDALPVIGKGEMTHSFACGCWVGEGPGYCDFGDALLSFRASGLGFFGVSTLSYFFGGGVSLSGLVVSLAGAVTVESDASAASTFVFAV